MIWTPIPPARWSSRGSRPPGRRLAPALLLTPLLLAAPRLASAEAAPPPDFAALRLQSVPMPGSQDERVVDAGPALEVLLSPSDFPDALLRMTLTGDAAAFGVNLDASAARGEAMPSRVRWPRLEGRPFTVDPADRGLPLSPLAGGRPVTADALEAADVVLEWYLRPAEEAGEGGLAGVVQAVRLASAEGRTLLAWSAPAEPSGCVESPAAGEPACRHRGVPRVVRSLSIHPSGRWIAVAGGDLRPRVDLLRADPVAPLRRIAFPPWLGSPLRAEFTVDGRHLVVADGSGTVHLWDAGSGGGHRRVASGARSFVLLDAGRLVAVSDRDGGLTLWRSDDGTIAARMGRRAHGPSELLAASGDGLRVAAVTYDEGQASIVVWDVEGARVAGRIEDAGAGYVDLALDAEGAHLLATHDGRGLLRHGVGGRGGLSPWGGEPARRCRGALAWSPDRSHLACATRQGVLVFAASEGRLVHDLRGGADGEPPSAIAFTPDGQTLVGTRGGAIVSWRLAEGREGGRP